MSNNDWFSCGLYIFWWVLWHFVFWQEFLWKWFFLMFSILEPGMQLKAVFIYRLIILHMDRTGHCTLCCRNCGNNYWRRASYKLKNQTAIESLLDMSWKRWLWRPALRRMLPFKNVFNKAGTLFVWKNKMNTGTAIAKQLSDWESTMTFTDGVTTVYSLHDGCMAKYCCPMGK